MEALTKSEIQAKIDRAEKQLKDPSLAQFHDKFKGMIEKLKADLAKLEEAKEDGDKPAAKAAGVSAAKVEKKIEAVVKEAKKEAKKDEKKAEEKKATAKKVVAKKAAPVAKAAPVVKSKPQINHREKTVTIAGKTYDIEGCEAAMEIWEATRAQRVAGSKKFAKKKEGTVIGDKFASAAQKVLGNISAAQMKKPSDVKEKLQKMSKLMSEFASLIDALLGDKSAGKEIKDAIAVIQKFMKEKLVIRKK